MAATRDKNLSYRRVVWLADAGGKKFEAYVRDAFKALPTVGDRRFQRGSGQYIKGIRFHPVRSGGVYAHLVAETPGDAASVLLKADEQQAEGTVGTRDAGPTAEWMDGDIFLFVRDDHVLICTTGLREATVAFFFAQFFQTAGLPDEVQQFDLQRIGNANKLQMIERQGVREIRLDASLYEATHRYAARHRRPTGMLGAAGRHFRAILQDDDDAPEDDLMMRLTLRLGRKRKGAERRAEQLGSVARELIESDDAYHIITKKNEIISESEITIRSRVSLEKHGKSVSRDSAWQALHAWYSELRDDRILDQ